MLPTLKLYLSRIILGTFVITANTCNLAIIIEDATIIKILEYIKADDKENAITIFDVDNTLVNYFIE